LVGYLLLPDGKKVDVADGLILGRTSSCAVVVKDTKASRRHAQLIVAGPIVEIEDLASSNGTLLNDKPVKRRMLRDGDVVQIGTTRILYREPELDRTWAPGTAPDQVAAGTVPDQVAPGAAPDHAAPGAAPDHAAPGEDLFADDEEDDGVGDEVDDGVDVLEFADEDVVQVPKTSQTSKAPKPDRPKPASAASQIASFSMTRTVVIPKRDRGLLAFGGKSGMGIGDDLRQMSPLMRLLGILVALAVAGGLGYLAFSLVS